MLEKNTSMTRKRSRYRIDRYDCCILWQGPVNGDGYGLVTVDGHSTVVTRVILAGKLGRVLGEGMQALHRCDRPPCINPNHLFEGTNADNIADKIEKGRQYPIWRPMAEITTADVEEIRERFALGQSKMGIARFFGISEKRVRNILNGKTLRYIRDRREWRQGVHRQVELENYLPDAVSGGTVPRFPSALFRIRLNSVLDEIVDETLLAAVEALMQEPLPEQRRLAHLIRVATAEQPGPGVAATV